MRRVLPLIACLLVALATVGLAGLAGAGPALAGGWGTARSPHGSAGPYRGSWGGPFVQGGSVSSTPTSFATTNGDVYAMAVIGNVLYLGGDFTAVTAGGHTTSVARLAAVDKATGQLLPAFSGGVDGTVRTMSAAPGGGALFVGGSFTNVDGSYRPHVAELDPRTGALVTGWTPTTVGAVDGDVWALAVSDDRVYLGGDFTSVNGNPVSHIAAVNRTDGAAVPGWSAGVDNSPYDMTSPSPATDGRVQALMLTQDGTRLYIGGYFNRVWHLGASTDAVQQAGAASLLTATGAVDQSFAPRFPGGPGHIGYDPFQFVTAFPGRLIVAVGGQTNALFSIDPTTGATQWRDLASGDVQTAVALGRSLYIGGHFHSYVQDAAGKQPAVDAARIDPATGRVDLSWSPRFVYNPAGNATYFGVWQLYADSTALYAGGAFQNVGGGAHPHLARFPLA